MLKILVTGGSGFIGSHTCLLLLEKGYELFIADSFVNSSKKVVKNIIKILDTENLNTKERLHIFKVDLRNKEEIERLAKDKDDQIRIIEENIFKRLKSLLTGKHFSGKLKGVKDGQIL